MRRVLSPRDVKGGLPVPAITPHVAQEHLLNAPGASVSAKELRMAYEGWGAKQGLAPLSVAKFAAELKGLGDAKWKTAGLIRYRDLRLAA
jgi:hypothetical protein